MSSIVGLLSNETFPAAPALIEKMLGRLIHRGHDRSDLWWHDRLALGHAALWTTADCPLSRYPSVAPDGLVVVADARLDNLGELRESLGLPGGRPEELILAAYRRWGDRFPGYLLGDFAIALSDPHRGRLVCARDPFGVRPLVYHWRPGFFALASEIKALLAVPGLPCHVNEGRIADFLVPLLEGIDQTTTFYEEIHRLPPAHTLVVDPAGIRLQRYWRLDPQRELRFADPNDYVEGFRQVFGEAVRCRLAGSHQAGLLLSGGIDSAAIAAVASDTGRPLRTYSAVAGEDEESCCIREMIAHLPGLQARTISVQEAHLFQGSPAEMLRGLDDLFDTDLMAVPALLYAAARLDGTRVVLDGVDGDIVTSHGSSYLAYLVRQGLWTRFAREAVGLSNFWRMSLPELVLKAVRQAMVPNFLRRLKLEYDRRFGDRTLIKDSCINPAFARSARLSARRARQRENQGYEMAENLRLATARLLEAPFITVALERYERVASRQGIKSCHPFFDRRLVEYCLALPWDQKISHGTSKVVLRRALERDLPRTVRGGRPRRHVAPVFWSHLTARAQSLLTSAPPQHLERYLDPARLRGDASYQWQACTLATWLAETRQERVEDSSIIRSLSNGGVS
ncbi:MAG: hypothetical protein AMXMBFR33_46250 [Candidatus Xenobia bacterium]